MEIADPYPDYETEEDGVSMGTTYGSYYVAYTTNTTTPNTTNTTWPWSYTAADTCLQVNQPTEPIPQLDLVGCGREPTDADIDAGIENFMSNKFLMASQKIRE